MKERLLALLRDDAASAAAKASAGRTLLEYFGGEPERGQKPVDEMTLDEINAEIAEHERNVNAQVNVDDSKDR